MLVVTGTWLDDFSRNIGNVIIPTDATIFFRGVLSTTNQVIHPQASWNRHTLGHLWAWANTLHECHDVGWRPSDWGDHHLNFKTVSCPISAYKLHVLHIARLMHCLNCDMMHLFLQKQRPTCTSRQQGSRSTCRWSGRTPAIPPSFVSWLGRWARSWPQTFAVSWQTSIDFHLRAG